MMRAGSPFSAAWRPWPTAVPSYVTCPPVRAKRWVVYANAPFAGPEAMLAYLSRYTHRVAIPNGRLIGFDEAWVTFRYKDYRRGGAERQRVMTLAADESSDASCSTSCRAASRRIRHYGLLAGATRKASLVLARHLLAAAPPPTMTRRKSRPTRVRRVPAAVGA